MTKHEAKAQTKWSNYINANPEFYGNFELKQSQTLSIPWSRFNKPTERRQINSLLIAQERGYYWKHSDADPRLKPFDCSNVKPAQGYIVIWWKVMKMFTVIDIDNFVAYMQISKEKSLSFQEAIKVSSKNVQL